MVASIVRLFFKLFLISAILWLIFRFASRLLALILRQVVGVSVTFRVAGWKCLRDVVVKFRKGAIESISVGQIKLSLCQPLVKLGVDFISKDPKLEVLICDLEVVLRPSDKSKSKSKPGKSRTSGRGRSRGKWRVVTTIARFFSVSVTDFALKTPKVTIEVKALKLDIYKDGRLRQNLLVKIQILPTLLHSRESLVCDDQSSNSSSGGCISAGNSPFTMMEKYSSPFICEEFSLSCECGHKREVGVFIKNVDVTCGEVTVNLNEELLSRNKVSMESSTSSNKAVDSTADSLPSKNPHKMQALSSLSKYTSMFPEKVCFCLPKLNVRFVHQEHDLVVENNIMGIQLKSIKSKSSEDASERACLDVQLEFNEIHLYREVGTSVLEILKLDVLSFVYIPVQPTSFFKAEVEVKLGGTQCNIIMSRLGPLLQLNFPKTKKKAVLEETSALEKSPSSESKAIMWTCTVSAPEMTVMLYSINGFPVYQCCSRASHVFANNTSNMGTVVHIELGEVNLNMADEYQESYRFKDSLFGIEFSSGCIMRIAKFSLDWGKKDNEPTEEDGLRNKMVVSTNVSGMGIYFTLQRVESLISTAISFQALLKKQSASTKKETQSSGVKPAKSSRKGIQLLKFSLEQCSVNFCGDNVLGNTAVADPKRVNYGSQGGQFVISVSADGTPRCAHVMSTISDECNKLKYSISLGIFHFHLSVNKEKQLTKIELERARSIYKEYFDEQQPATKVTLFDMRNTKFVRRSSGVKESPVCSLFSASNIALRWEPDVQLSITELVLQLKLLIHNQKKLKESDNEFVRDASSQREADQKKETIPESGHSDKQKNCEEIFAIDIEMLSISAEVGDGVDAMVQVQSIFSENARVGVLLEGLLLGINRCRVLKSSRMQILRIPTASSGSSNAKMVENTTRDLLIQGLDVHICLPYHLELRAIDDSIEEMVRALKLIIAAKTSLAFPNKKESPKSKSGSVGLGCVKFFIRKLTAEIEDEPLQGWLDEHYHLMKNEACELAARLKFLDDLTCKTNQCLKNAETSDSAQERKMHYNGVEIDAQDPSPICRMREEIYKQSFRSYYNACQNLVPSKGSGAYHEGFQAGFKPSTRRTSLLSISVSNLDVSLTLIDGGDNGIIEVLKKLDPVVHENNIPFSRLYGGNIILRAGSLVAQLRNYTFPLLSATSISGEGRLVLAQQATCFQPQIYQDVFIGKWRKVRMLHSARGTTPPVKSYLDLLIRFQKMEASFGVGFEPVFADVSYALTIALRRANLSVRNPGPLIQPPKKEKNLPWWDDMRNFIHGKVSLCLSETVWHLLATTDPYEKLDKLLAISGPMEVHQSDGRVCGTAKDFRFYASSLESLANNRCLKLPKGISTPLLEVPAFTIEATMDWGCDSGTPLNHYLHASPIEGESHEKVFDPFRSTSLSLRLNISLRSPPLCEKQSQSSNVVNRTDGTAYSPHEPEKASVKFPTLYLGAHDLAWITKFWMMHYLPPKKLRSFARWPRFGVPRVPRSGNLSLDRVMTEFMIRAEATPFYVKYIPLDDDDAAKGLTYNMAKLKFELCNSRGKQKFTFECKRQPLDLVYLGFDIHMLRAFIDKEDSTSIEKIAQMTKNSSIAYMDNFSSENSTNDCTEKHRDDGFLLSSDYFTIKKQTPKADPASLLAWQEAGRRNLEMTDVRSEYEHGSESDEHARSDPSDDEGYNVVIADNCKRVFVYGFKLLWTIENRDAALSFGHGMSKSFERSKHSPRQHAPTALVEENQLDSKAEKQKEKGEQLKDSEEEGTRHFMVNIIEPQFNLHSEEANGRFLLAAVSGRVLARSFHSILDVGYEMIEKAVGTKNSNIPNCEPKMMWKRMELSAMLEHVQAHVAPTDIDPGAGVQWLPRIRRSSPKVKRTGALLERVFMPCDMYFRYTRHKGGTPELKVKPLKELTFNSHNIVMTMTSHQFRVMMDVLTNLLATRMPKSRKSSLSFLAEDDDDYIEEEADQMVPVGVEEVELAKVNLEQKEWELKLVFKDISELSFGTESLSDFYPEKEGDMWMIACGKSLLVQGLKRELLNAKKSRKAAYASLRTALLKAAEIRLMEREKNKRPSHAMRVSLKITKVIWSMLLDGKSFAEAEINEMIYNFDRDYRDVGVVQFTTKYFVIRNCLPNAKSDMLLSPWNPPPEWGKKVMLQVDAKQGAPREGNSFLELVQVEVYPLKIHLTEAMYRTIWAYLFPDEEQDSLRRQEFWKVSTTAGLKRVKKGSSNQEAFVSTKDSEVSSKSGGPTCVTGQASDSAPGVSPGFLSVVLEATKLPKPKVDMASSSTPELKKASSLERSYEESVTESGSNESVQSISSSKTGPITYTEQQDESSKNKMKDPKVLKSARQSHEEKKMTKSQEDKKSRPRKLTEFRNFKISQVELLVTYEGSRFNVSDLKLLMDTFHRVDFIGTWGRLFSRVKKHVIWGVLKSVTGMQGKKFNKKVQSSKEIAAAFPDMDPNFSDDEGGVVAGKSEQHNPVLWAKRPSDGAGDGFVTSVKGLFHTQRRKAKAFMQRSNKGVGENEFQGDWSESDTEVSPFARQLTMTKAKRLIRRHSKKYHSRGLKGSASRKRESLPSSPRELSPVQSDSSHGSLP